MYKIDSSPQADIDVMNLLEFSYSMHAWDDTASVKVNLYPLVWGLNLGRLDTLTVSPFQLHC